MLSEEDRMLVKRDPELPGLAQALDPEYVGHQVGWSELEKLTATYIRYKAGVSALVGYEAVVHGEARRLYVRTTSTANAGKLQPSHRRPPQTVHGESGFGHDPSCLCSWWVFPNDAAIHALRHLIDEETRQRFVKERFGLTDEEAARSHIDTISYKPERRFVGRLHLDDHPIAIGEVGDARRICPCRNQCKILYVCAPVAGPGPVDVVPFRHPGIRLDSR